MIFSGLGCGEGNARLRIVEQTFINIKFLIKNVREKCAICLIVQSMAYESMVMDLFITMDLLRMIRSLPQNVI